MGDAMRSVLTAMTVTVALLDCGAPAGQTDAGATRVTLGDFSLVDLNPASATSMKNVSPHDFDGRVSAWYFGHSS